MPLTGKASVTSMKTEQGLGQARYRGPGDGVTYQPCPKHWGTGRLTVQGPGNSPRSASFQHPSCSSPLGLCCQHPDTWDSRCLRREGE